MSKETEYHGNVLETSFTNPGFINEFQVFARRKSPTNPWTMHGVAVPEGEIEKVITRVQENLIPGGPYYAHFYRDDDLIVVFKERVFRVQPDKSTWTETIEYGRNIGIPGEQLDFAPARFEDEKEYYERK